MTHNLNSPNCTRKKIIDIEKAKQAYQDVLTKYQGSIYVVEGRKRYRILRGDNLETTN